MSPYEWQALAAALALLALVAYGTRVVVDQLLSRRRDADRTARLFLSGRWWS